MGGWVGATSPSCMATSTEQAKDLDIIRLRYHTVLNRKIKISYTLKLLT
jgi:hypothetical protein